MNRSDLWNALSQIKELNLNANSTQPIWSGQAKGKVEVSKINDDALIFSESGEWDFIDKPTIKFFNIYRWRLVRYDVLELAHLRNGMDSPVHLLDFTKFNKTEWRSGNPHLCREDVYAAVLLIEKETLNLKWTIDGPLKKQIVECIYF